MVEKVSDFKMPEKIVTRLLKDALPDNVLVSKEAKSAACRGATIFILQLSIAAAEKAEHNKRRHLDNQDIIKAVTELGLGEYAPQLVRFGAQRKRNAKRRESSILKSKANKNKLVMDEPEHFETPEPNEYEPDIDQQHGTFQEDQDDEELQVDED